MPVQASNWCKGIFRRPPWASSLHAEPAEHFALALGSSNPGVVHVPWQLKVDEQSVTCACAYGPWWLL